MGWVLQKFFRRFSRVSEFGSFRGFARFGRFFGVRSADRLFGPVELVLVFVESVNVLRTSHVINRFSKRRIIYFLAEEFLKQQC